MIKYHGTPITPKSVFAEAMEGRNVLISFAQAQDLIKAIGFCSKIMIDNGAFTFWKTNRKPDWNKYYDFVSKHLHNISYFFIPDVIDGTEEENDLLIDEYLNSKSLVGNKAIPVWHIHESFDRLKRMMTMFDYIAIGSSGEYSTIGTKDWHERMREAMKVICCKDGIPKVKIHMLRCLNHRVFTKYPFYSGDSTNLARNHHRDGLWTIINRVEKHNSPHVFKGIK